MPRKTNFTTGDNAYYRTTATVGKNPDGTSIRKQFYGASKREAEQKRNEFMTALNLGFNVDYNKATFAAAFAHWLEHVQRSSIGPSTYAKYARFHRLYIAGGGLAGMRLIDIRSANLQAYYNGLLETTTANNVHEINKLLKIFFKYCFKAEILIKNPLLAVELPKLPQKQEKNTALSDTDIEKLIRACKEDMKHFPFVFAMFTGLRSGEMLALTHNDLDFSTGMINVDKSVTHLSIDGIYQALVSDAKTAASVRRVPILAEIRPMLLEHIGLVKQASKVISITDGFLLFPSATGTYRNQVDLLKLYKHLCDDLGIEKGLTIHSLRHTFCTILARQGVSLLDASRLMGHANINITAKIYSHVSDDDKKAAVKKLAAYFN